MCWLKKIQVPSQTFFLVFFEGKNGFSISDVFEKSIPPWIYTECEITVFRPLVIALTM